MLHATDRVTGSMLWANLHLLFWLSLIPFTTHWLGEHHDAALPVATYGFVLFMASVAYWLLQQRILASQGPDGRLHRAIGVDWKGKLSPLLYACAIALAYLWQWLAIAVYVFVALMWLVPDRRIERALGGSDQAA
jgi:TMEM175 potassium channel family protein